MPGTRSTPLNRRTFGLVSAALLAGADTAGPPNFAASPAWRGANPTDPVLPPLGKRVCLKRTFAPGRFPPRARGVLEALENHGMILADLGGDWFVAGAHDMRWDDESPRTLRQVKWRDHEVVKLGPLVTGGSRSRQVVPRQRRMIDRLPTEGNEIDPTGANRIPTG